MINPSAARKLEATPARLARARSISPLRPLLVWLAVIAPVLVEKRSSELRTACGEVEADGDAEQKAGFAADCPICTRIAVYEVMSVRGWKG